MHVWGGRRAHRPERNTVTDRTNVVVTGLGAITPLGADAPSTWESLLAGRSGVTSLTEDLYQDLPARIAAWAAADPATLIDRVQARRLDRCEQFALVAAREAWADAGSPEVAPERVRGGVSSGIGGVASTLKAYDTLKEKGWSRLSPYTVPMLMPNGSAGWLSIELGARAGVHTTVSACASGAEAIGYAMEMIRSGRADVVVAGGTEAAIIPLNIAAFAAMRALSTRNDEPERASRPFDRGRDGFVLGEGAGMVGARVACARAPPGRHRVRDRGRRRLLGRRPPHRAARPGCHRGGARHPARARRRARERRAGGARERARHLHAGRRHRRVPGDRHRARPGGQRGGDLRHQIDDRSPARRRRCRRVGGRDPRPPRAGGSAHHQSGRPRRRRGNPDRDRADKAATAKRRPDGRAEQLLRLRRSQCRPHLYRRLSPCSTPRSRYRRRTRPIRRRGPRPGA